MTRPKPLICPWCGSKVSMVLETRDEPKILREQLTYSGDGLWRKRECCTCHGTFASEEAVTAKLDPPITIRQNSSYI